ncbi:hypothetical protein ACQKWADRAFT_238871 [Trichoderma austrokoningii]
MSAEAGVISAYCNKCCAADGPACESMLAKTQVPVMYIADAAPRLCSSSALHKATAKVPRRGWAATSSLHARWSSAAAALKAARQLGGLVTSEWGLQPGQPSASAPP